MDYNDKDYKAMVDKVAQARRDAYAACPRDSNDHLEAALFFAMLEAAMGWQQPAEAKPEPEPASEPEFHVDPAQFVTESEDLHSSIDEEPELGLSEENHERND